MPRSVTMALAGWGNYPIETAHVYRPERIADIRAVLAEGGDRDYIPRGAGRAYGDAALNRDSGVILNTRLDRFLAFDAESMILECEAGVVLGDILEVFLPRGLFLPVVPGTKFVTVGGAIAANIHGKN